MLYANIHTHMYFKNFNSKDFKILIQKILKFVNVPIKMPIKMLLFENLKI